MIFFPESDSAFVHFHPSLLSAASSLFSQLQTALLRKHLYILAAQVSRSQGADFTANVLNGHGLEGFLRKNDAKWGKGRKRKYPTEGKHSQWFNTGRYSAGKASAFRRKPGFKSILRSAGRSRFIIYLDSSVPLTQAAFPVSFHIPGPSQTETGRVVQRLCKRCQRDAAKALLLLRCHHGLAGTCC